MNLRNMNVFLIIFVLYIVNYTFSSLNEQEEEVVTFLKKYGYWDSYDDPPNNSATYTEQTDLLRDSVSRFQEFYNLPVTGEADMETMKFIRLPRCGNKDLVQSYSTGGDDEKWKMNTIKWYILKMNYGPYVEVTKRAFDVWAKHTNLNFIRTIRDTNIFISFKKYNHTYGGNPHVWCPATFDGPGGTLAHAFFPNILQNRLEIHMDANETWNLSDTLTENTTSLFLVMVHEIGHALGLHHSDDNSSIMWPSYKPIDVNTFELSQDDINGIQKLYGKRKQPITTTPATTTTTLKSTSPPKTTPNLPDICEVENKFYGFVIYNRVIYVFYKQWAWLIDVKSKRLLQKFPVVITDWIQPLREVLTINSTYKVCLNSNGDFIFIINDIIYTIDSNNFNILNKWNFSTSELGLNALSNVNGVVTGYFGASYIFFDDQYVIQVDDQFYRRKKIISLGDHFPGIPPKIDGIYKSFDGVLNFFIGNQIVRYNEYLKEVIEYVDKSLLVVGISCPRTSLIDQLRQSISIRC